MAVNISKYLHDRHVSDTSSLKLLLAKATSKQLQEIAEDCIAILGTIAAIAEEHTSSLFNFTASKAICGAGVTCMGIGCRAKEAQILGQFASLYGDSVRIPNFLKAHYNEYQQARYPGKEKVYREILLGDLTVLVMYEPLIEAGLITFNNIQIAHCTNCMARKVLNGKTPATFKRVGKLQQFAESVLQENVIYEYDGKDRILFKDTAGWTDLDQHRIIMRKASKLKGIPERALTAEELDSLKLVREQAGRIIDDVLQQNIQQHAQRSTFLTPRRLDAVLLDKLNSQKPTYTLADTMPLSANTSHRLPLIKNGDFEAIINVRRGEEAYFNSYQSALTTVLKQLGDDPTPAHVKEAIDTEIKPHLLKIDHVLQANKIRWEESLSGTLL